jgi:hypothetical protein
MAQITWTAEQVASLAPDTASLKAGRQLATATHWQTLGQDETALWGEVKGSGARPYQVGIDVEGPAFKCTCPSRKFPCKHALGLSFIFAASPAALTITAPPAWVTDWLQQRQQRATQAATRAAKVAEPVDDATLQKRAAAQEKRAAERLAKVEAGIDDLQQRLLDVMRQGLAAHAEHSYRFWDEVAKRMIDAQAPGLARLAHALAPLPHQGEGWQGRMLTRMGQLHLLLQAFRRLDTLSTAQQADVRSLIGLTPSREAVLEQDGVHDAWWVLGQQVEHEDTLRVQRSWLWGARSQRSARILHFATGTQPFEATLCPGDCLEAELVFYPSAWPLRGLFKTPPSVASNRPAALTTSFCAIAAALQDYATALAASPWIERYPLALAQVIPWREAERWSVYDTQQYSVPLAPRFADGWRLLALSGGQPLALFGEWDGEYLWPLSAWAAGEMLLLSDRAMAGEEAHAALA